MSSKERAREIVTSWYSDIQLSEMSGAELFIEKISATFEEYEAKLRIATEALEKINKTGSCISSNPSTNCFKISELALGSVEGREMMIDETKDENGVTGGRCPWCENVTRFRLTCLKGDRKMYWGCDDYDCGKGTYTDFNSFEELVKKFASISYKCVDDDAYESLGIYFLDKYKSGEIMFKPPSGEE